MVIHAWHILCDSLLPTSLYLFLYHDRYLIVLAYHLELAITYCLWISNGTAHHDHRMADLLQRHLH